MELFEAKPKMKKLIHDFLHRFFPRLWFVGKYRVENEYQEFVYSRRDLAAYGSTLAKLRALSPVFRRAVEGKSFLEIGCDTGFFPMQAALFGARRAVGLDRNAEALERGDKVKTRLGLERVEFRRGVVPHVEIPEVFDTVLFLSIIHYMFSDTCGNRMPFASMDSLVSYLAKHTKNALFLEFVTPEDPMVGKLVKDELLESGEYSEESLVNTLKHYYEEVEHLGRTANVTRPLYAASHPKG